ncbi:MAG: carboxypeptidase-like regulatory domain-containing protein, partial [Tannerellaceae bacterium]|nr:carboxypeptidase-like regulatory domain-containing protein [Tannerellaceae bacterium]
MIEIIRFFIKHDHLYRMNKPIFVLFGILLLAGSAAGQTVIRGKVLDENAKEPVTGASINVKSTAEGTITDINGRFEFRTKQSLPVSLVVRFVGYKSQEITIYENEPVEIILVEDVNLLNEVVVTAGGIIRTRREQGYSTTNVTDKELTAGKAPSLAGGLTGKVAG